MLIVQPLRYEDWAYVPGYSELDSADWRDFNTALYRIGMAQAGWVDHRIELAGFGDVARAVVRFPFLASCGIVCNNAVHGDSGGLFDTALIATSWLLSSGSLPGIEPGLAGEYLTLLTRHGPYPDLYAPTTKIAAVPLQAVADDPHGTAVMTIAAHQYNIMNFLCGRAYEEADWHKDTERVSREVLRLVQDGHSFCFLGNLGALAFLMRGGVFWCRVTAAVSEYADTDLALAKRWVEQLADADPPSLERSMAEQAASSWTVGYPGVTTDREIAPSRHVDGRLFMLVRDAMDQDVYGAVETAAETRAAAERIGWAVTESRSPAREVCRVLNGWWRENRFELFFAVLEVLGADWFKNSPLLANLLTCAPPWERSRYFAMYAWLDWLTKLASPAAEELVVIAASPFQVAGSSRVLLHDKMSHAKVVVLLRLAEMLSEDRYDRAVDVLEEFKALVSDNDPLASCVTVLHYGTDDLDELVSETIRVLRRDPRGTEPSSRPGPQHTVKVAVRCIHCFGEWLDEHGYRLISTDQFFRGDGAEWCNFEIQDSSGRTAGQLSATCIAEPWFRQVFQREHPDYADEFYVAPADREPEDEGRQDFLVSVWSPQAEADRPLADLLEDYWGRYHGRVPQNAARVYREFRLRKVKMPGR